MANNWKILDGVNYIAKTGSGTAGTMEAPRALSATAFVTGKNVIGAGSYIWPAGFTLPSGANLYGDGFVKILGDTNTNQQSFGSNNIVVGIYFEQWAGIVINNVSNSSPQYSGCVFDLLSQATSNLTATAYTASATFTNCLFSNCNTLGPNNINVTSHNNCLLINSQLNSNAGQLINSYLDANSGYQTTSASIVNVNVDPTLVVGITRGLKVSSGAWGNGQAQAGCTACITQAPQFNGPARFDFTLNANSPHVTFGIGPAQLGAATSFTLGSSAGSGSTVTTANASITNSIGSPAGAILAITGDGFNTNTQGGWALIPTVGGTYVSVFTTGAITINANGPQELTSLNFIGALNINTDFQPGAADVPALQNNNVPDFNTGTAAGADRKPNRMSVEMRWSILSAPDVTNATHWVSGAAFVEMEWFAKPTYNLAGYLGNANVAFVPVNSLPVYARTVQIRHTVRNNYGA